MRKSRHTLFSAMMTVAAALFLICASVSVLLWLSVPLYGLAVRWLRIPEETGITAEVCSRNYEAIARYLVLWGEDVLTLPDFTMSASGTLHFRDVRQILLVTQILAVGGVPVMWIGYRSGRKMGAVGWLRAAAALIAVMLVTVLAGIIVDRTGTFIIFHKLFFTNSYWQFDVTRDPVIQILTENVFLAAAVFIFLLLIGGSVWYLRLAKKGGQKRKKNGKNLLSHGKKLHGKGHH